MGRLAFYARETMEKGSRLSLRCLRWGKATITVDGVSAGEAGRRIICAGSNCLNAGSCQADGARPLLIICNECADGYSSLRAGPCMNAEPRRRLLRCRLKLFVLPEHLRYDRLYR